MILAFRELDTLPLRKVLFKTFNFMQKIPWFMHTWPTQLSVTHQTTFPTIPLDPPTVTETDCVSVWEMKIMEFQARQVLSPSEKILVLQFCT